MHKILPALLLSFALLSGLAPVRAADDPLKADHAKLQGKWKSTIAGASGQSFTTLEIKADKSILHITNKDGDTIFKGESDFKLEKAGKFKVYTYSNLKVLAGDSEGQTLLTEGKSKYSIYKFDGDIFVTVGGVREDDEDKPRLVRWEKLAK